MEAILKQFNAENEYNALIKGIRDGHIPCMVNGICDSARPFLTAAVLKETNSKGLVVVSDEKDAYRLQKDLELFFDRVLIYPVRDFVFDNVKSYSREWEHERLSVLQNILTGNFDVIITLPDAMSQYTIPRRIMQNSLVLKRGQSIPIQEV